jgi:uncharacterized protein (TIGR03435 family)
VLRRALIVCLPLLLAGQSTSPPAFEAASIRQNTGPDSRLVFKTSPNGVTITNYRFQFLIPNVFDIPVYAVSGEPEWWSSNRYDIVARAPEGTTEEQLPLMLQQLLVDRFKLKFHREQKDLPGYALVIAKDGLKLKVDKGERHEGDGRAGAGRGHISGQMISSGVLTNVLSLYLLRPVLDQTGIDGAFNVDLKWTPGPTERAPGPPSPAAASADDAQGPSLFAALQEQLGLRLVSRRTSVEMFVIDHVEPVPTEN